MEKYRFPTSSFACKVNGHMGNSYLYGRGYHFHHPSRWKWIIYCFFFFTFPEMISISWLFYEWMIHDLFNFISMPKAHKSCTAPIPPYTHPCRDYLFVCQSVSHHVTEQQVKAPFCLSYAVFPANLLLIRTVSKARQNNLSPSTQKNALYCETAIGPLTHLLHVTKGNR